MLQLKQICKTFSPKTVNEHKALQQIDLTIHKGDFVTVVGSNGAGKSTLFNVICGNFFPDQGTILLDGKNITWMAEHKRASLIGRVFQDPMRGTAPNLTIEENLALAYSRSKRGPLHFALNKKDTAMFQESLAQYKMGLEDRMKTKVGLLSGGQRQVVTLLMCTLVPPKLLLLDEHTAALDPAASEKIMQITKEIVTRHQLTTMMITHNLNAALQTGNRTIMMDSGKLILDISGKEREQLSLQDLLALYSSKSNKAFDNDRMLLT